MPMCSCSVGEYATHGSYGITGRAYTFNLSGKKIFAMRVLTYNIRGWRTLDGKPNLHELIAALQASDGDVEGRRPGFTDMVGRAKYDAWAAIKGTPAAEAMQQYIALIEKLKAS